jgi:hypothetical protein
MCIGNAPAAATLTLFPNRCGISRSVPLNAHTRRAPARLAPIAVAYSHWPIARE